MSSPRNPAKRYPLRFLTVLVRPGRDNSATSSSAGLSRRCVAPSLATRVAHSMHLSELKALHVSELIKMGEALEIENVARMRKQELMFAIMKKRAKNGEQVFGDGVLEVLPDGFGFLRSPEASYMASTDDIYLSPSQVRRFNLHTGDMVEGEVRVPKDGERYFAFQLKGRSDLRPKTW